MSTEHRESDLIRSWLDETYEAERDSHDYLERLLDEVSDTPQQRRRWWPIPLFRPKAQTPTAIDTSEYQPSPTPASNGHTPTVIGRTTSMLSPVKAITAGALAFAIGGTFLIAQPFDQQSSVPGADAEMEVQGSSSYFTGEMIWEGAPPTIRGEDTIVDGVLQARGAVGEGDAIEVSDPRVSGSITQALNANVQMFGESEIAMFRTLAWRIENDAGAWTGQGTNLLHDSTSDTYVAGEHVTDVTTMVLTGEGDYEGHTVYMVVDWIGEDDLYAVEGAVFVGEAPPFPEVPALAE